MNKRASVVLLTIVLFGSVGLYFFRWKQANSSTAYPLLLLRQDGQPQLNPLITQKVIEKGNEHKLAKSDYTLVVYADFNVACPNLFYEAPQWSFLTTAFEQICNLLILTSSHTTDDQLSSFVENYDLHTVDVARLEHGDPQNYLTSLGVFKILYRQGDGVVLFQQAGEHSLGVVDFPERAQEILLNSSISSN